MAVDCADAAPGEPERGPVDVGVSALLPERRPDEGGTAKQLRDPAGHPAEWRSHPQPSLHILQQRRYDMIRYSVHAYIHVSIKCQKS